MSSLGEHVYRAITGGRSPHTEGEIGRQLAELQRGYGGARQAADAIGVARSTFRRWLSGGRPSERSQSLLLAGQRRARLSAGRERRLRSSGAIKYSGVMRVSGDTRTRTVDARVGSGIWSPLIDQYLAGAPWEDLAEEWSAVFGSEYVPAGFSDIERIELE